MKKKLILLSLMLGGTLSCMAGDVYYTIPLQASMLNGNVVIGATESKDNVKFDNTAVFYNKGVCDALSSVSSQDQLNHGMPTSLNIDNGSGASIPFNFTWTGTTGNFDGKDCIHLTTNGQNVTVNLTNGDAFKQLYFCATAGNFPEDASPIAVTVTYIDGNTDSKQFDVCDWYQGNIPANAYHGLYRRVDSYNEEEEEWINEFQGDIYDECDEKWIYGPMMYCLSLNGTIDANKPIRSITFTQANNEMVTGIFAITGVVNDAVPAAPKYLISVPSESISTLKWKEVTKDIAGNTTDVTSYVYDIANDADFTDFVSEHVNKPLSGTLVNGVYTATIPFNVEGKYVRIRALNSTGASRNTISEIVTYSDESVTKAELTAAKTAATPRVLQIARTFWKDGYYNSLCLPFTLDADALAASPLAGYNALKKFVSATVTGTGESRTLNITLEDATSIEAGVPYMISWAAASENLVDPVFEDVIVTKDEAGTIAQTNMNCNGTFIPKELTINDKDLLFLGVSNTLYWPNTTNPLKGFRCYFKVNQASGAKYGMPAMFEDDSVTGISQMENGKWRIDNVKFIENGKVVIMNNGVRYNAAGQQIR